MKQWILPVIIALLIVVNVVVLTRFSDTSQKLVEQQSMIIETKNTLESRSKALQDVSEQKMTIDASLKEERLKTESLQGENQSLKVNLQAKKEREAQEAEKARIAAEQAVVVAQAPKQAAPTVQVSGSKADWLAASGIPQEHWGYVDSIVTRESGWNPNAVNKSSGACGLGQQLPCGKWAGAWNDPVAALQAMTGYVNGRYGGWPGAVAFWNANHWY